MRARRAFWWCSALGALWMVCVGMTCGPTLKNCQLQQDCPGQSQCINYQCQPLDSCKSDSECQSPRTCFNGLCTPPGCSTDKDCSNGRICNNRQCVEPVGPACKSDSECASGQVCRLNVCIPDTRPKPCKADSDCPTQGDVCQSGTCTKPPVPPCKSDSDCRPDQTCQGGTCQAKATGICRLNASRSSLSFSTLEGTSQTLKVTLTNDGDGTCEIDKLELNELKGDAGKFTWKGQAAPLAAKGTATIEVTFEAIKYVQSGTSGTLEIFARSNRLLQLRLFGSVKPDTTLPTQGWAVAYHNGQSFDDSSFIGGCFWSDGSFEAYSSSAFSTGGINLRYGNVLQTKDGGKEWSCVNCTSGQNWPREAFYELVDMRIYGVACKDDIGYLTGTYATTSTMPPNPVFLRLGATETWKRFNDPKSPLQGDFPQQRIYPLGDSWFFASGRMLLAFQPDPKTGQFQTSQGSLRYVGRTSSGGSSDIRTFDRAQGTGLLVTYAQEFSGGRFVSKSEVRYNTNDAKVPSGTTGEDTLKHWPKTATLPCPSCQITSGVILGARRFLVAGSSGSASSITLSLWLTNDQGQSWKQVFTKTSQSLSHARMLRYSDKKIFVVIGDSPSNGGFTESEGLLLVSTDGGDSFQSLDATQFKGQPLAKLPALHGLVLSPDRKTLYALGRSVILRWKP